MPRYVGLNQVQYDSWVGDDGRQYTCGYCGTTVTPIHVCRGILPKSPATQKREVFGEVRACTHCGQVTFFRVADGLQMPGVLYGDNVEHLPTDIATLYEEARTCYGEGAFNACAMACRKILLHVAEEKGLKVEKKTTFIEAVNYLFEEGWMPKSARIWIDALKKIGNDANHKIELVEDKAARIAITFTQQMLENVFQNVALAESYREASSPPSTPDVHP